MLLVFVPSVVFRGRPSLLWRRRNHHNQTGGRRHPAALRAAGRAAHAAHAAAHVAVGVVAAALSNAVAAARPPSAAAVSPVVSAAAPDPKHPADLATHQGLQVQVVVGVEPGVQSTTDEEGQAGKLRGQVTAKNRSWEEPPDK